MADIRDRGFEDYQVFTDGITTINAFIQALREHRNNFNGYYGSIDNDAIFKGDIADSCFDAFDKLDSMLQTLEEERFPNVADALSNYLQDNKESQQRAESNLRDTYVILDNEGNVLQYQLSDNLTIDPNSGWVFPIAKGEGRIDKTYGQFGTSSQGGYGGTHNGIDVVANPGTNIYAASDATVYYSGWDPWTTNSGGYGYCVVLKDAAGNYQIYGHMQGNPGLQKGSSVKAGETIGKVGSSGNTPGGPHLHFEVRNGMTWNGDISRGLGNFYNFNNIT